MDDEKDFFKNLDELDKILKETNVAETCRTCVCFYCPKTTCDKCELALDSFCTGELAILTCDVREEAASKMREGRVIKDPEEIKKVLEEEKKKAGPLQVMIVYEEGFWRVYTIEDTSVDRPVLVFHIKFDEALVAYRYCQTAGHAVMLIDGKGEQIR